MKEPLRWPNSSLSTRFSGKAPQLTGMNARSARRLLSWRLRATSSLPVPVSPRIMTEASVGAIVSISRRTCCMVGVSPIKRGMPSAAFKRVSSAAVLFAMSRRSATRFKIISSSAHLQGLVR